MGCDELGTGVYYKGGRISTHTSRVGCDAIPSTFLSLSMLNFYSHIPCGMWHISWQITLPFFHFYSHIPCGMWLLSVINQISQGNISTHTSRVGCDNHSLPSSFNFSFLLTHPVWDVTILFWTGFFLLLISTHTSRVGCDYFLLLYISQFKISTHTSRVGCDRAVVIPRLIVLAFLLTHPVWDVTY